jgi:hypothetical protein
LGTVEDKDPDAGVDEAVDGALDRLAGEDGIAAEPAVGGHDVDLGGLPPKFEDVGVGEHGARADSDHSGSYPAAVKKLAHSSGVN